MRMLVRNIGLAALFLTAAGVPAGAEQGGGAQSASDVLPSGYRGSITYSGTHSGTLTRGRQTQQLGGSLSITLTFDGNRVTARYSGTGGINQGTMTGTRSGGQCRLVDDRGGDMLEAACTQTRFSGVSRQSDASQSAIVRLEGRAAAPQVVAVPQPDRHGPLAPIRPSLPSGSAQSLVDAQTGIGTITTASDPRFAVVVHCSAVYMASGDSMSGSIITAYVNRSVRDAFDDARTSEFARVSQLSREALRSEYRNCDAHLRNGTLDRR